MPVKMIDPTKGKSLKNLLALALLASSYAQALTPAQVDVVTDPSVVVRVSPRKGNTSKNIDITVNKQDKVTQNGKQVYPVPPPIVDTPPPPPPVIDPVPIPVMMHGGIPVDESLIPTNGDPGSSTEDVKPTTDTPAPNGQEGAFRTSCAFSHMAFDDPIVFPGEPGKSHLHTFSGNTLTSAATTAESLRNTGNSTCRGGIVNRSAYWTPAMIDTRDNRPIAPDSIQAYYKSNTMPGIDGSQTQLLPPGLRMISSSFRFKCIGGPNNSNDQYGSVIPKCDVGAVMWQENFFPACWDGVNLDSVDHKSHMSYPQQLQQQPFTWYCPATHPVLLPQISINTLYTVTDANATWRLSSDMDMTKPSGYSSHADWFNGWEKTISDAFVTNCTAKLVDCHSHLLGDGREIY